MQKPPCPNKWSSCSKILSLVLEAQQATRARCTFQCCKPFAKVSWEMLNIHLFNQAPLSQSWCETHGTAFLSQKNINLQSNTPAGNIQTDPGLHRKSDLGPSIYSLNAYCEQLLDSALPSRSTRDLCILPACFAPCLPASQPQCMLLCLHIFQPVAVL